MDTSWLSDMLKSQDDTNKDIRALHISVNKRQPLTDLNDEFDVDTMLDNMVVEWTDNWASILEYIDFDAEKAINQMVDEKKEKERQFFIDLKNTLKSDGVLEPVAKLFSWYLIVCN